MGKTTDGKQGRRSPRAIVIGSGVSGILTGIKLKQRGIAFTILEKAETIGGTWRDNTYPGLTCDVPSHLYVYSFEPNPNWTQRFPPGREIWQYYYNTAKKYGILPRIRFNKEAVEARWTGAVWRIVAQDGEVFEAEILITGVSRLHEPAYPNISGLETFAGPVVHSARWNHDLRFDGKRVGLVGTGSTSAQILSSLVDRVARLSVFQRTPQWVLPIPNAPVGPWLRRLLRFKIAGQFYYRHLGKDFAKRIQSIIAETKDGRAGRREPTFKALELIKDPALRAKLTPDYEPSCKRMVISDKFHAAVQRPNVDLVTDPIDHVEARGVVTRDGRLHPLDILLLATGFVTDRYLQPMEIVGADGLRLAEVWKDLFQNYLTVAVPGMPNFFMINGPYGPLGSAVIPNSAEVQVNYVMKLIDRIATRGVSLAPKAEQAEAWLEGVRDRARRSVFGSGGCQSYYLDKFSVPTINPQTVEEMREEMKRPDFDHFIERALKTATASIDRVELGDVLSQRVNI